MKNTKIGTRIIIALAFPVVAMLVFSGFMVVEKYQTKKEMGRVLELAELAPVISAVAHELQKERGMSAGFIASKGVKFARDLPEQRKLTNEKRTAMAEALKTFDAESFGDGISENIAEAKKALGNLASKRTDVTARKITVPQMAGYYTPTIGALLHIVEDMSGLSTEFHITTAINAYTAFLQGKERAGIERAMGAGGFGAHQFKPVIHHKFVQLIAMQKTFLGRFNIHASQEQKAFYKSTMTGPVVDEVNRMRKIAIDSPITGSTGDVDATHWFKTITAKINLLKTVEDKIASDLQASTAAIETAALTAFIVLAVITLVLMILTAAMVYYVVTGITRPLADMTDAMSALAEGDKKVEVPGTDRGDEIGAMAETVQVFKDN
ncbi:MAG: HAMP domain-containing protein, partial [Alphaproteobacteria bacterium]|nr:HAMP domain-containing protein [Alphaproteobacteria bacterium]